MTERSKEPNPLVQSHPTRFGVLHLKVEAKHFCTMLGVILLYFASLSPTYSETAISSTVDAAIANAIYQVKIALMGKFTSIDIENMINRGHDAGISPYKINRYANNQMGWSVEDSKGREVFSVIFSFIGTHASEGTYYGPLMQLFQDAKEIHKQHSIVMDNYFKKIESEKYDIGDSCTAFMELFKGRTSAGRTKIIVKCN